jgi:hypothetical protein
MRRRVVAGALVALLLGQPLVVAAQQRVPAFERVAVPAMLAPADTAMKIRPTYWKEGGIVLGGSLFVLAVIVGAGWCGDTDSNSDPGECWWRVPLGAAFSGALGFGVGALIGGLFPKGE